MYIDMKRCAGHIKWKKILVKEDPIYVRICCMYWRQTDTQIHHNLRG